MFLTKQRLLVASMIPVLLGWVTPWPNVFGQQSNSESRRRDATKEVAIIQEDLRNAWKKTTVGNDPMLTLARFVGFVDGRLGATPPDWWERLLLHMETGPSGPAFRRDEEWIYPSNVQFIHSSDNVEILVQDEQFEVRAGKAVLLKEKKIEDGFVVDIVSAIVLPDTAYLILASHNPKQARLVKVDIKSNKVLWRTSLRGDSSGVTYQGRSFHFVQPVLNRDGNIVVYGASPHCMYIESFSAIDGEQLARFSIP